MNLEELGFGPWFRENDKGSKPDAFDVARVAAVHKESYIVTNGLREARAEVTGKLMFSAESPLDYPTVGDFCYVQFFDEHSPAIIHEIIPRRTILKRKTAGKKVEFQALGANIETAFIVQSLDADFSVNRLERYLVMIRDGGIDPVILLSKRDLVGDQELDGYIGRISSTLPEIPVIAFSDTNNTGLEKIDELLQISKTFCLLGSSGVGKTTLLNKLLGDEVFATREVREKDSKGKHTTTARQMIFLKSGAMVIDTPGMRELGNIGIDSGIEDVFEEFTALESECKYSDCLHTSETGCAILLALESGEISEARFENYTKMKKESAFHEMSYNEKRKRDKEFGKLYKSVQKHNIKNR